MPDPARRSPYFLPSIVTLFVVLLALFSAFLFDRARGHRGVDSMRQSSAKKNALVTNMQMQLLAAAEAEKSAVMAETDEASDSFATESRRASALLERDRSELGDQLEIRGGAEERQRFREFSDCWSRSQKIDREILGLAVENTNLKAQRLSFTAAAAAVAQLRDALDMLVADTGANTAVIAKAAYQLVAAAGQIHALESRHIAEPGDAEMDGMEAEMSTLDRKVNDAFAVLSAAVAERQQATVATARAAYADFQKVHREILRLSRRNSNVRSLAISLGEKRKVTAECQDRLHTLHEVVSMNRAARAH